MTSKLLPESSVLAPRDPSILNPDDWPEFRLNDATVTLPNGKPNELVSLLLASENHPLTVIGKLEPVAKDLAHTYLLPGKQKTQNIEVANVRSFAYGVYEDGSVEIWATGQAGWFVINPAKRYQRIYNEMVEGVNVLFFIADAYKTVRKSGKGRNATVLPDFSPKEIFEKYAEEEMEGKVGAAVAAERMYKHRDFLISSMVSGKEGLVWGSNPLYKHLYKKFPEDFAKIKQRLAGPPLRAAEKQEAVPAHARQPSIDSASTSSSLKRKRGRPPKNPADAISVESSSVGGSAAKEDPKKAVARNKDDAKTKSAVPLPTRRRGNGTKVSTPDTGAETPEIQESQPEPRAQDSDTDSIPDRAHKGKSALRLKPNKPTKGPPKSSKARKPVEEEEEEEDEEPDPTPAPAGKRNKHSDPALGATRSTRSTKQEIDEGIDIPTSPSSDELANTPSDTVPGATDTDPSLPLRLNHAPDPLQEDTWICALDGCTHKVYSASLTESQKLIREHYALHAYDDDERVQLVKRLQAPSLPAGRLMERVRGVARLEGFPGSKVAGSRFPEAVRTRY